MNPSLLELDYTTNGLIYPPSLQWILLICLQFISIALSAFTTFNALIETAKFNSFKAEKRIGLFHYLVKVFQVMLHMIFATLAVYLSKAIIS